MFGLQTEEAGAEGSHTSQQGSDISQWDIGRICVYTPDRIFQVHVKNTHTRHMSKESVIRVIRVTMTMCYGVME